MGQEGDENTPLSRPLSPDPAQYELMTELGQCSGIIGHVALARHLPTRRALAVKFYELDHISAEDAALIQHEIILAKQLSHHNILPCLASFVWGQSVCVLSPLMELGSCRDLIVNHFPDGLPELAVALVLRDVLQGLDYIHHQSFVLRSLRASHFLVSTNGHVRLGGLRYATTMVINGRWQKTLHDFPSSTFANLNWLSPELLEQNLLGYNEKSDIYSLGIATCEMANGVVPYADLPAMLMLTEKLGGRAPGLLDRYAFPFLGKDSDGCQADSGVGGSVESATETTGLSAERREFSEPFHQFVEICLARQPELRPGAARLLHHSFFKQCRRHPHPSLSSVLAPAMRHRISSSNSHEITAERMSDLQLDTIEWDF